MKYRVFYFFISLFVILSGIFSLMMHGLTLGIDFTGGSSLQFVTSSGLSPEEMQTHIDSAILLLGNDLHVEKKIGGTAVEYTIQTTNAIDATTRNTMYSSLLENEIATQELRYEMIGPVAGKELLIKMLTAVLLSAGGIAIYVGYRFQQLRYGVSAVVAMLHDSMVLIGSFSLLGWRFGVEVDLLFVTALLTILSFSVHDTIVVYDRIRELRAKDALRSFEETIDMAVTETLGRSFNNSMTIILMLFALWLLGGETLRMFVLALLIGTVTGTYSSPFVAAPLLLLWKGKK